MEIAFTTPNEKLSAQDVVCVVTCENAPRKGDVVQIDTTTYIVDEVEWYLGIVEGGSEDYVSGEVTDIIVRLIKQGA